VLFAPSHVFEIILDGTFGFNYSCHPRFTLFVVISILLIPNKNPSIQLLYVLDGLTVKRATRTPALMNSHKPQASYPRHKKQYLC
jgi:hypothetical protein